MARGDTLEWQQAPPPSLMAAPSPAPCMSQSQDRAAMATQGAGLWGAPPCTDPNPGVVWLSSASVGSASRITRDGAHKA